MFTLILIHVTLHEPPYTPSYIHSRQHYKMNLSKLFLFVLMFVVETDEVTSVSVMMGDSVTLRTDLTGIQTDDKILWKFEDNDEPISPLKRSSDWRPHNQKHTKRSVWIL